MGEDALADHQKSLPTYARPTCIRIYFSSFLSFLSVFFITMSSPAAGGGGSPRGLTPNRDPNPGHHRASHGLDPWHLGRGGSGLVGLEQGPRRLLGSGREGGVAAKPGHGGCSRGIGLRQHAAKGDEDGAGWRDRRAVLWTSLVAPCGK
jgi:hypothetical protein